MFLDSSEAALLYQVVQWYPKNGNWGVPIIMTVSRQHCCSLSVRQSEHGRGPGVWGSRIFHLAQDSCKDEHLSLTLPRVIAVLPQLNYAGSKLCLPHEKEHKKFSTCEKPAAKAAAAAPRRPLRCQSATRWMYSSLLALVTATSAPPGSSSCSVRRPNASSSTANDRPRSSASPSYLHQYLLCLLYDLITKIQVCKVSMSR